MTKIGHDFFDLHFKHKFNTFLFKERYEFVEIQIDYTDLLIFAILLLDEDLSTLSFVSAALVYDGYAVITKFSAQSKQINAWIKHRSRWCSFFLSTPCTVQSLVNLCNQKVMRILENSEDNVEYKSGLPKPHKLDMKVYTTSVIWNRCAGIQLTGNQMYNV